MTVFDAEEKSRGAGITHVLLFAAVAAKPANVSANPASGAEVIIAGSHTGMHRSGGGSTGGANCIARPTTASEDDADNEASYTAVAPAPSVPIGTLSVATGGLLDSTNAAFSITKSWSHVCDVIVSNGVRVLLGSSSGSAGSPSSLNSNGESALSTGPVDKSIGLDDGDANGVPGVCTASSAAPTTLAAVGVASPAGALTIALSTATVSDISSPTSISFTLSSDSSTAAGGSFTFGWYGPRGAHQV